MIENEPWSAPDRKYNLKYNNPTILDLSLSSHPVSAIKNEIIKFKSSDNYRLPVKKINFHKRAGARM